MLIQRASVVYQLGRRPEVGGQIADQRSQGVSPCIHPPLPEERPEGLLGCLVRGKTTPFVIAGLERMASVAQVSLRLPQPVHVSVAHRVPRLSGRT